MRRVIFSAAISIALAAPAWAGVLISEFQALNGTTISDEDGEFSDWIELYNSGSFPVDLHGWSLTDNAGVPFRWRFPRVTLEPGDFLLVFASGKDRRNPDSELHTNFRLSSEGEFLGLVSSGGNLVSAFSRDYPEQLIDSSYGFEMETASAKFVVEGATVHYLVPESSDLGLSWIEPEFDGGAWASGPMAIGYDRKEDSTYQGLIQTDVGELMEGVNATLYLRVPFQVSADELGGFVQLQMRYESGFIAYINGAEVAVRNARIPGRYNSRAIRRRSEDDAVAVEVIPITQQDILVEGENVLAIHAQNDSSRSPDLLMLPELVSLEVVSVDESALRFFRQPTPGWPNTPGLVGVAQEPVFSRRGGTFQGSLSLELSVDSENAGVFYTLDGTEPTESSQRYSTPISIDSTLVVKAKTFEPGLLSSRTIRQSYVKLSDSITGFTSNLPLFIVNTFGRPVGQGGENQFTPMHITVIDRDADGRSRITSPPHLSNNGGIKIRGSSTAGRDKASYGFEIQDDHGEDKDVQILGFPEESDYILYGAFNFDRAHVRNAFIYTLSNMVGRYAVRTRFCELFLNDHRGGTDLNQAHYRGIYTFMEKIKRGPYRVPVARLLPEHSSEPEITGGYILKIDRADPGESGFSAAGQTIRYVYPKQRRIVAPQSAWIRDHFNAFGAVLNSPNLADPETGYARFIDVDSWIDHHILNVLAKNVDAFRLSGYFFKGREGKIEMGPIWDFDRSMQSTDGRDDNPRTWDGTGDATRFFQYPWWNRLFQDPEFWRKYRARWNELRRGPLSTQSINALLDSMGAELSEAAVRDAQKWRQIAATPAAHAVEINRIKVWLAQRTEWIDSQFIETPLFTPRGGEVHVGQEVALSVPKGEIYYTVNGPDPSLADGNPAPEALPYEGPITIRENTRIRARARVAPRVWSEMVEEVYITEFLPLVVTEVMYNPAPEDGSGFNTTDFEFIEFQNVGDDAVDLTGVRLAGRVRFEFTGSEVETLGPGEYGVVMKKAEAFEFLYGNGINVAGEYVGILSNRGQLVSLVGPLDEVLFEFSYQDAWYPSTDGEGHSLVIQDASVPRDRWSEKESWRPSIDERGSPGREDVPQEDVAGLQLSGDFNQDARLNISDAVGLLFAFTRGVTNMPCETQEGNERLLDVNGDRILNLSDAVYTLNYLFQSGEPPVLGMACVRLEDCPESCGTSP